jgi:hypothetical protein
MAGQSEESATIVTSRLTALCFPVDPELVIAAVEKAGFSGSAYLQAHPQVGAVFPTPRRACIHFLLHGFAERRRFPIDLAPAQLERLYDLPIENRTYVTNLLAAIGSQIVSQANVDAEIEAKWPSIACLQRIGAVPFLLIGSSDARNYGVTSVRGNRWLLPLRLVEYSVTAMSLGERNSELARRIRRFIGIVDRLSAGAPVSSLMKFGQVDVEFAYNLSRVRDEHPTFVQQHFEAFCARSIGRYGAFLDDLAARPVRRRITCASIFPSSVSDAAWADGFLLGHAGSLSSLLDAAELERRCHAVEIPQQPVRTNMNRYYNDLLRACVNERGYRFSNDFDVLLNPYGVIDDAYVRVGGGRDCHIDLPSTTRELSLLVWKMVEDVEKSA